MRSPPHSSKQGAGKRRCRQAHTRTKNDRQRNIHTHIASRVTKGPIGARGCQLPWPLKLGASKGRAAHWHKKVGKEAVKGRDIDRAQAKKEKRGLAVAYLSMQGRNPPPPSPFPPAKKIDEQEKGCAVHARKGAQGDEGRAISHTHAAYNKGVICTCRSQYARLNGEEKATATGGRGRNREGTERNREGVWEGDVQTRKKKDREWAGWRGHQRPTQARKGQSGGRRSQSHNWTPRASRGWSRLA